MLLGVVSSLLYSSANVLSLDVPPIDPTGYFGRERSLILIILSIHTSPSSWYTACLRLYSLAFNISISFICYWNFSSTAYSARLCYFFGERPVTTDGYVVILSLSWIIASCSAKSLVWSSCMLPDLSDSPKGSTDYLGITGGRLLPVGDSNSGPSFFVRALLFIDFLLRTELIVSIIGSWSIMVIGV